MVLQLGNWGLVPGQNPAIRHGCQADSWPARRVVSQSIRHSVSPGSSESMHGHAVTCCLGQTKLCGQHLLVAHFAAFCFWLTGSLRVAGGGGWVLGTHWLPVVCFAMPKLLYRFAQYVCTIWRIAYITASMGIHGYSRASTRIPGRTKRPR